MKYWITQHFTIVILLLLISFCFANTIYVVPGENDKQRIKEAIESGAERIVLNGEFNIDGILELPDLYDHTRGFRKPYLERWLKEAGVPLMSFDREYYPTNVGQLKTRIGAFVEILRAKA